MKANACLLILCGWLVCTARAVADEPSVVFRSPAKEAAWIGVQIIEAACEGVDPKSVAMVEIYLDGKLIREFSAPPYRLRYDFGSVPQNHKLAAVARAMGRQILASAEIRSAFYDDTTSVEVTQIVVPVAVINENNIYVPESAGGRFYPSRGWRAPENHLLQPQRADRFPPADAD